MGWCTRDTFDRLKAEALALTPAERDALTWEEARRFVAPDTLEVSALAGASLRRAGTPWQFVAYVRGIGGSDRE